MSNYYETLSTLANYSLIDVNKIDKTKSSADNLRHGLPETEHRKRRGESGGSTRSETIKRHRLESDVKVRQNTNIVNVRRDSSHKDQPGMKLGPSDPLPGPYFNLFSADDDDDTEYEPGTDEEDLSEDEIEEEVDPEEWILDLDKDFALPQDYVLPPYLNSLPPELQMFAPELPQNSIDSSPEEHRVRATMNEGSRVITPPRYDLLQKTSDLQYSIDPYHYTPGKSSTDSISVKELLSRRRDEMSSLAQRENDSEALKQLQTQYFRNLRTKEEELLKQEKLTIKKPSHKRTPHNAGKTSNDIGVEMFCEYCDRVFRGPKASTHKQQHIKRIHPENYVKKKG
jgi:hypothetical protein